MAATKTASHSARPRRVYANRVLDRTFRILDALARDASAMGVTELADELKLHKSTVHRLLAVLERGQFVERSGNARYRLGWKLFDLGTRAAPRLHFSEMARQHLERLVELTGETAHLGILRQGEVISVVDCESRHTVRTPATVGRRSPAHCSSLGKVLLAGVPPEVLSGLMVRQRLVRHTKNTITDLPRLRAELALVSKRGYAIDNEEIEEGLFCIGAPVRDHSGATVAAISIAGPAFRMRRALPELVRRVTREAAELSGRLGYGSDSGLRALGERRRPGPAARPRGAGRGR